MSPRDEADPPGAGASGEGGSEPPCIGIALVRLGGDLGLVDTLAFGLALALGAILLYCFWLVLATGSFWIVQMWFLPELFEGIFQPGRWPIGIYPDWLRFGITFLVPIAFAITVPAEAVRLGSTGNRSCSRPSSR